MKQNYSKIFMAVTAIALFSAVSAEAAQMDKDIESLVKQSYVFKTYLKDDAIKVKADDGVVTLTGTVADESNKSLAQETAANLPGVRSVDNQLEFEGEELDESSDGWISMQAKTALLFNRNVSGIKTKVFVEDGIVTLKGEAKNQAQKDLAEEYAKDVNGVKGVKNEITIAKTQKEQKQAMGEKIDDASITAQVKTAFSAYNSTSAFKTGVKTNDGVVMLSGEADNRAAKEMAGKVANNVNGVKKVVNNMTVKEDVLSMQ